MASIYKRGPYQWQVLIRRKGFETQSRVFNTKAEAETWAKVTESEMVRGVFVSRKEAENTTLAEALDRYETEISSKKKSHSIEKVYIRTLKKSFLSSRFLSTIQGKDIARYRDGRLEQVSPTAVRHELALLSHLFTISCREWGISGIINPVSLVGRPRPNAGRDRRLQPGEMEKLLTASPDSLRPIIRFALETAMRRGEIAGMTWEMVDLEKRTVILPETKNGEKRIVPLSMEAVRILSELPRRIDGKVWELKSERITQAFRTTLKKAEITDMNFHDLRHEATSRLFELGLAAEKVKEITGHKTYSMLSRYTHLKAEDIALEIDRLEKERDRKAVESLAEKPK